MEEFRQISDPEGSNGLSQFLAASAVIDWGHPAVMALAAELRSDDEHEYETARRCFEWVRDNVKHSADFGMTELTCHASHVLVARTGFCYAKSHLLAALLRANQIPTGFCYQRLSIDGDGPPFCLHGLNAIHLPKDGWYRVDARGDKSGVETDFSPPVEKLAFSITLPGELDLPEIWAEPLPVVVNALRAYENVAGLAENLPDVEDADSKRRS